ncbi:hypothetical protein HOY34_20530 [Xinfangfangia sp. D13-10-4-6]|uniref:hypothetical protein n=1 Tax=Pseudogemmobacter hezensis TaxID=2737662 RepID=UPI001555C66B|nr:hypothetical protein [Pseudogemmobacter hezensis]NPD17575.1 hypothetical protein [Pseudogemmobacter hezensis]
MSRPEPEIIAALNPAQRLDVQTYVKDLGLSPAAAIAKVTAPKRRVTCVPPDMRPDKREARS